MNYRTAADTPTTTFARIKAARPCESNYKQALRKAGGLRKYGENTPITVRQIVEAVGLDDALWCLRTMPEHNARWRLLAVRYARRVQHLMRDPRSVAVLDVAERHAHGAATDTELDAARAAAEAAARAAAEAAARAAAEAAAGHATWAAGAAARAAAGAATWATWDAARAAEAAARDAARAARAAARAAAWAAWDAGDAGDAARAAEREWQAAELIRICEADMPELQC